MQETGQHTEKIRATSPGGIDTVTIPTAIKARLRSNNARGKEEKGEIVDESGKGSRALPVYIFYRNPKETIQLIVSTC